MVGNDVWIGRNSVILPGIHIGDGAIIAAHSVVTKDVPSYAMVGGNPAKMIKMRFEDSFVEDLLRLKWWDRPPEELLSLLPLLCDTDLERAQKRVRELLAVKM